jgi:hypothetical protein
MTVIFNGMPDEFEDMLICKFSTKSGDLEARCRSELLLRNDCYISPTAVMLA